MKISRKESVTFQTLFEDIIALEKIGKYPQAFDLLKEIWTDISELPDVAGLPPVIAAETFLRCGSIISHLGNSKQIFDAQEKAKNLLTTARNQYKQLYKVEKIAECENRLALAYFHKGENQEAIIWAEEALSHSLDADNETRLQSHIIKSAVLLAESKYHLVISYLESVKNNFEHSSHLLKGSFATNISLAHKNLAQLDSAIHYLKFARYSHQKSKHLPYLATVENNLAQLYKLNFDFDTALHCADNAIACFTEIGDRARIAFAMDTKAQVLIANKNFGYAVDLANEAIEMLQFGDNAGVLSEVFLTKATALIGLDKIAESVLAISESVQFAKIAGNSKEKQIADSFELSIYAQFPVKTKKVYSEKPKTPHNLSLELPPEILPNQDFFGIWIKNKAFEKIGLRKGNLAIGAKGKVLVGDLVAVCDRETDLVTIGFFENQYGLICLENLNREPELLDEYRVTIMGKIVGYADPETNVNDCYEVKPILPANLSNDGSD